MTDIKTAADTWMVYKRVSPLDEGDNVITNHQAIETIGILVNPNDVSQTIALSMDRKTGMLLFDGEFHDVDCTAWAILDLLLEEL